MNDLRYYYMKIYKIVYVKHITCQVFMVLEMV